MDVAIGVLGQKIAMDFHGIVEFDLRDFAIAAKRPCRSVREPRGNQKIVNVDQSTADLLTRFKGDAYRNGAGDLADRD